MSREEVERLGYTWGDDAAPIHVVEFSDFGCGYCKQFHEEAFSELLAEFVETGQVHWRFVPFNVGMFPNADGALKTAECAGAQDRILEASDALFARQREWKNGDDAEGTFQSIARDIGVDVGAWQQCMDEGTRTDRTAANTNVARRVGIRGTPTFFVDGYPIPGALPLDNFRAIFRQLLADRSEPATPS